MKNRFKILELLFVTALLVGCSSKKSVTPEEQPPEDVTPDTPQVVEPIENDSGLPTNIEYLSEPGIMIHYQRFKGSYLPWGLWLWSENAAGAEYEFNYADDYGVVAYYPKSLFVSPNIGFIVKQLFSYAGDNEWVKDYDADRFLDTDLLQLDEHNCYNIYIADNSGGKIYTDKEKTKLIDGISSCQFEDKRTIIVQGNNPLKQVVLYNGEDVISESNYSVEKTLKDKKYKFTLNNDAAVDDLYRAYVIFESDVSSFKAISIRKLYDASFEETYKYDGELGAIYTPSSTTFKVWSPVSQRIDLNLYENGTPTSVDSTIGSDVKTTHSMIKDEKGVFSVTISGDIQGKYYTYSVYNASFQGKEIVDPYAKGAGVNGLRGMVVDFSETNPVGWDSVNYLDYDRKELTVYETHIVELTCSETWGGSNNNQFAKKYKGFYETGTTYTENETTVSTGFDHIKELGVNAVQIIPFFDQANDEINPSFNWGYNPLNYNVVEGCYSTNPYDGYVRINELKNLVKAYNESGIEIIMDVVYNHVNGLSGSNFDVLMPFYYFRYTTDGQPGNGSGCGNETASDKYMFRKFMVDSVCFWTKEYKLGGFRFDLMGLHDIETMNKIVEEVRKINPFIVIYGEPWAGGDSHLPSGCESAVQANAKDYVGFGQFNDIMRDAMIKSGMNRPENRGWIVQTEYTIPNEDILAGLQGKTGSIWCPTDDPDKTVNYATCHDNYTLHDRILVAGVTPDEELYEKMNVLANSIVFTCQGTTFMLAGEEMLRTKIVYDTDGNPKPALDKDGNPLGYYEVSGNSYSSSYKTNEINYSWKVNHPRMMENYKKLIAIKQNSEGLHGTEYNAVESLNGRAIVKTTFTCGGHEYVAYHGNGVNDGTFTVNTTGYQLYLDTLGMPFVEGNMAIHPFETLIIYK